MSPAFKLSEILPNPTPRVFLLSDSQCEGGWEHASIFTLRGWGYNTVFFTRPLFVHMRARALTHTHTRTVVLEGVPSIPYLFLMFWTCSQNPLFSVAACFTGGIRPLEVSF